MILLSVFGDSIFCFVLSSLDGEGGAGVWKTFELWIIHYLT